MNRQEWVMRALLVVVLAASVSLFFHNPKAFPPSPRKETDIQRVFAQLPERNQYKNIDKWCGLRIELADSVESKRLGEAVEVAPDPKRLWCGPLPIDQHYRDSPSRTYRFPDNIRWYKLIDPKDVSRWIGIGVYEHHNTGWTAYWIRCRVPVGFEPSE